MRKPVFQGSGVAIVTPFRDDFVDFGKLGELIEFQIQNGTDAIVVCGTTGEASTQTIPEHLASVEYAIKRAAGRVPVIAGTGSNDTAHAVMMSQNAEKSGADALLMVTPYYNKTSQAGLVKHFTHVADRVNIPIILYNVPSRTNLSFTAETYLELSKHPNINGVKEASGNFTLIAKTRSICPEDFYLWSGNDDQTVAMMSLGAQGVISVMANIMPRETAEMCKHALGGDFKAASELQLKLFDLMDTLFIDVSPIPVKTALNLMGMDVGHLRMPLCELSPANTEALKRAMRGAGLILKES
jgi:4-hydroxy-tetrahydrodipicolinate synthase